MEHRNENLDLISPGSGVNEFLRFSPGFPSTLGKAWYKMV